MQNHHTAEQYGRTDMVLFAGCCTQWPAIKCRHHISLAKQNLPAIFEQLIDDDIGIGMTKSFPVVATHAQGFYVTFRFQM